MFEQELEGARSVDRVALHQDSFRPLDLGSPPEGAFEVVVLSEAAQHDVDRALPVPRVGICDVGEDATFRGFSDDVCVRGMERSLRSFTFLRPQDVGADGAGTAGRSPTIRPPSSRASRRAWRSIISSTSSKRSVTDQV
jgi:hypothetical protein